MTDDRRYDGNNQKKVGWELSQKASFYNYFSQIYGVMGILCSEQITTVFKCKLKVRNRLWNTGAVTQESLQNSSLGKVSVSFRVKEK